MDYSSHSMEASQIWVEGPHQHQTGVSPAIHHELEIQVNAFTSEMDDVKVSLNSLGFSHPGLMVNPNFLQLQEDQAQPVLNIPSPSELQYWELEQQGLATNVQGASYVVVGGTSVHGTDTYGIVNTGNNVPCSSGADPQG